VTLMRFDPFRELDRVAERTLSGAARALYSMPMEAFRRGDQFMVLMDLPGVSRDDIDLTIERNVVSVRVRRAPVHQEGDEVIIDERPYGEFARQLFLGDNLDPDRMSADVSDGVLTLTIPVSEASKPRRVALGSAGSSGSSGDAGSAGAPSHAGPTAATGSGTASAAGPSSAV
jgi:HSP20 family protein